MNNTAVLGLQYGDEGKGKLTHSLARDHKVVCRFNGSGNSGHTIYHNGKKIVTHSIPCGIVYPGVINIIGNGCLVDPIRLCKEIEEISSVVGVFAPPRLFISPNAHVITWLHIASDEAAYGHLGTTKRGVGPCMADKVARIGLRLEDFFTGVAKEKLISLNEFHHKAYGIATEDFSSNFDKLTAAVDTISPFITSHNRVIGDILLQGDVLFEGAQSVFLDPDVGDYPFVTSTNTTIGAVYTGAGIYVDIQERIGVFKAYSTRVAVGPFLTEMDPETADKIRTAGGEYGATTARPRRCGWLDLVQLKEAVRINGINRLAMMKMDVLKAIDEIKICYRYENDLPIYLTLPSWKENLPRDGSRKQCPIEAQIFIRTIEDLLERQLDYISVGPHRGDEIW